MKKRLLEYLGRADGVLPAVGRGKKRGEAAKERIDFFLVRSYLQAKKRGIGERVRGTP